ncbi:hypothetical protein BHE74_00031983 [Ensete ventricosum]|uniref:GATA-type domain-containing protein n=1 Tax=Ensete ventricosum TaxID=4639 RepID=A0A445MGJ7_ENSVE|nr:hypothetical protein BHE74_00031983 [Ensete ventricosum]RZR73402.1 hypothetical protein BHM03_00023662 [Ensete ventricosum]
MEAPEYLQGVRGTPHFSPEKAAGGDHFIVEDLLDFSNGGVEGDDWGFDAAAAYSADDSSTVTAVECCCNSSSSRREPHVSCEPAFRSFDDACLSGDLCGPVTLPLRSPRWFEKGAFGSLRRLHEELAELEWLSNFVEESFSGKDVHRPQLISGTNPTTSLSSYAAAAPAQPPRLRPEAPVLARARSKRSRPAPCSWSSRVLVFSPSTATASSPELELIKPPSAVPGNKAKKPTSAAVAASPWEGRRCLHCQADKTPQWRAGPMGPKTLCNACGVRYKSGRLVPEYRPAASPTFVPSKHSNSHRKVLELRHHMEQPQLLLHDGGAAAAGGDGNSYRHVGPDFRPLT